MTWADLQAKEVEGATTRANAKRKRDYRMKPLTGEGKTTLVPLAWKILHVRRDIVKVRKVN